MIVLCLGDGCLFFFRMLFRRDERNWDCYAMLPKLRERRSEMTSLMLQAFFRDCQIFRFGFSKNNIKKTQRIWLKDNPKNNSFL